VGGGGEKLAGGGEIGKALEKSEESGAVVVELIVVSVDNGGDASYGLAIFCGEEKLNFAMVVKGIFLGVEVAEFLANERRRPKNIALINLPGKFDEALEHPFAFNRQDF